MKPIRPCSFGSRLQKHKAKIKLLVAKAIEREKKMSKEVGNTSVFKHDSGTVLLQLPVVLIHILRLLNQSHVPTPTEHLPVDVG